MTTRAVPLRGLPPTWPGPHCAALQLQARRCIAGSAGHRPGAIAARNRVHTRILLDDEFASPPGWPALELAGLCHLPHGGSPCPAARLAGLGRRRRGCYRRSTPLVGLKSRARAGTLQRSMVATLHLHMLGAHCDRNHPTSRHVPLRWPIARRLGLRISIRFAPNNLRLAAVRWESSVAGCPKTPSACVRDSKQRCPRESPPSPTDHSRPPQAQHVLLQMRFDVNWWGAGNTAVWRSAATLRPASPDPGRLGPCTGGLIRSRARAITPHAGSWET